jgi:hypothetical protein
VGVKPPASNGRAPVKAYRCSRCGWVTDHAWAKGHRLPDGQTWCPGEATGPYYLLDADDYIDVMLAREAVAGA